MEYWGIAAAPGYGMGKAFLLKDRGIKAPQKKPVQNQIEDELGRFDEKLCQTIGQIEKIRETARQKMGDKAADIFTAHIMLLEDPEYLTAVKQKITGGCVAAETAVEETTRQFLDIFSAIDDEYIRERAADLKDVSGRLLRNLLEINIITLSDIDENAIICAHDLTPSDTAQLNPAKTGGFITNIGGHTSHSAIMARAMNIPAVTGLKNIIEKVENGDFIIVDGTAGKVFINPSETIIQEYRQKIKKTARRRQALQNLTLQPTITKDGVQVELTANIGSPSEGRQALANGAAGVGLYRTEFLFMGKTALPTEEEQFAAYREIAGLFGERPVIIRTLDIGGDKGLSYLDMPQELNPFLGYRAIRLCLDLAEMFKTQLRAVLRAGAFGNIKMIYPMITTIQELHSANQILNEVKQELSTKNIDFNPQMEVGMMVEIPAAAVLAEKFAPEVDFFSIGTNDLIQYTMAADRLNEKVAHLYQPFNPAVLHLIQNVIAAAHSFGKRAGMCGEMAGDLTAIPLLLGMGLDEFSMSASSILPARDLIRRLDLATAGRIARTVFEMADAAEIKSFLAAETALILENI